jgi:hypothetical protein
LLKTVPSERLSHRETAAGAKSGGKPLSFFWADSGVGKFGKKIARRWSLLWFILALEVSMKSFDDAQALVRYAKMRQLPDLDEQYCRATQQRAISSDLLIATKHLLDSLRSALDYTACGLRERALGPPAPGLRIYYPYARMGQTRQEFVKVLDRSMPGYAVVRPEVAAVMADELQYYAGSTFGLVPRLMELSNARKHHSLGDQLPLAIQAMRISVGQAVFEADSLVIAPGGAFNYRWSPVAIRDV